MNENVIASMGEKSALSRRILPKVTQLWFICAVIGQWWMVYYLVMHFGGESLAGNFKPFTSVSEQHFSMFSLALHILLGAAIMIGGPLQLVPQIRQKAPKFHRLNGRVFSTAVAIGTLFGLYLIWTYEKMPGGIMMLFAMNLLVAIIFICLFFAIKHAMAKNIKTHRKWALRLFLVVNAGWFFRVGLMAWLMIHQAPVGFDPETFEGPFIIFLAFAQFVLPLLIVEWFFYVNEKGTEPQELIFSFALFVFTLLMVVGILGAGMTMWKV